MDLSDFLGEERELPGAMAFDMSQIALAAAFQECPEGKINPLMLRHLILNSLKFNFKKFRDEYPEIILCFDNAEGGYWRRDYGYYYKKTRAADREESSFDWDGYFSALATIKEEFKKNMPYYVIDIKRVEADDSIGVLAKEFFLQKRKFLVMSTDGDYGQLQIFDNVKQWGPAQKKFMVPKVTPSELLMTKLLKGDRKDTVAGVKCRSDYWLTRIEGERAPSVSSKLIQACLDDGPEKHLTEEEFKRFKENQIMIDMNYIPDDIRSKIIEAYTTYEVPGRSKIYPYFVKSGLVKMAKDINMF